MRHRKVLMMMAGVTPTPYEKRVIREQRALARYARDLQSRQTLMELATRRERGDGDTKPMPFAKDSANGT